MKILKYIFLLLLLSAFTLSIFVLTQKEENAIERSRIINFPKSYVYNYTNDLNNWTDWNSLTANDSLIKIIYSPNMIGKGSLLSWQGKQGNGDIKIEDQKKNNSIYQTINFNNNSASLTMKFKDTLGKTKVSWKAKVQKNFISKALTVLYGGSENIIGHMLENSLINLDRKLNYEKNTFNITVNGLIEKPEVFYLSQTFTSEFSKIIKNSEIVISKLSIFCKKNNIIIFGKPFIIYHTIDEINKYSKISICIPIKDRIFTTEGSDISSRTLNSFQSVKTTLTGDYSHMKEALDKTKEYALSNHLDADVEFSHIETYTPNKKENQNPSKWTTEIYYPIKKEASAEPKSLLENTTNTTPTTESNKKKPSEL